MMNLQNFRSFSSYFNSDEIEGGLVRYFLFKNGLSTSNNFLNALIKKDKKEEAFIYLKNLDEQITISDLEKMFELFVNPKDKQVNGAVYTPDFIVDYITKNTINEEGFVCDPACGSGVFLIGSLKRLHELTKKPLINIIEEFLFGVDILEYSTRRAKIILSLYALLNGEDKANINFNIKVADSLETDWKELFPEKKFNFIVGNPPYVRIQDFSPTLKKRLSAKWRTTGDGNFNLYFPFFELGIKLLSENGRLGYIVPNNYFTSLAGKRLREYLSEKRKIWRILNFNHLKIFQNASTYTCITLMSNANSYEFFEYHYLNNPADLGNLDVLKFDKVKYQNLNNKKWRVLGEKDFLNVKTIETIGTPIGKLFKIRVGIATLKDKAFFVNEVDSKYCKKNSSGKEYKIEKGITRKIVKISTIDTKDDINISKKRIIFPYEKKEGRYYLIPEEELKKKYPLCYAYLQSVSNELGSRDKGKKEYPSWYAYGRTQGFNFHGGRLYTRTFSNHPNFILDEEEDSLFCNGYAIFIKNHIKAYQRILNSRIMDYYIKKTSTEIEGNFQCYQKNFIEKFTIPKLSEDELKYLEFEKDENKVNAWLVKKYALDLHQ